MLISWKLISVSWNPGRAVRKNDDPDGCIGTFKEAIMYGVKDASYHLYLLNAVAVLHVLVKRRIGNVCDILNEARVGAERKLKETLRELFKIKSGSQDAWGLQELMEQFDVECYEFYMKHSPKVTRPMKRAYSMSSMPNAPHVFWMDPMNSSGSTEQLPKPFPTANSRTL